MNRWIDWLDQMADTPLSFRYGISRLISTAMNRIVEQG